MTLEWIRALRPQSRAAWGGMAGIVAYLAFYEKTISGIGITLFILALFVLLIGRHLTAVAALGLTLSAIALISLTKKNVLLVALHSSDVLLIAEQSMLKYLWTDQRRYVLGFLLATAIGIALVWLLLRVDDTRVSRAKSSFVAALLGLVILKIGQAQGEFLRFNFTNVTNHVTNFYGSIKDTIGLLRQSTYFRIPNHIKQGFYEAPTCVRLEAAPNIIVILQESLFPPSLYSEIQYNRSLDSFFRSHDGKTHTLRVETFGSGTWLSEFSILTGLSSEAFGGLKAMVPQIMSGRLEGSLPQWLKHCGYTNVEFNPYPESFVFSGKFHRSLGFDEILDKKRQGANSFAERDRFYYANALERISKHFSASEAPMFVFILTSASHSPYNYPFDPQTTAAGGRAPEVPEMNEFLRRAEMSHRDYAQFVSDVRLRFPSKRFLVVHFGDHQPAITQPLILRAEKGEVKPAVSIGYLTYYAVEGINYHPPALPALEVIDVPYLSALIPRWAGLPDAPAGAERLKLMEVCVGRYAHCTDKEAVDAFQTRLFSSGLLKIR